MDEKDKCNGNCACGRNLMSFKFINDKQIDILRNGQKVGEIWSWKPSNHEFNEDTLPYDEMIENYRSKNGVQICGFDSISELWSCGIFPDSKDIVVTFSELKKKKIS